MRLYQGKIPSIARESIDALLKAGQVELVDRREAVLDIESVLMSYVKAERAAVEKAKDYLAQRNLPHHEFGRLKRLAAEQRGIKTGEDTLDYLLDQTVEMLLHSNHVEEVYGEDHQLRRTMAPIFKRYMSMDDEIQREARGRLKHVQEGTSSWEVEYRKVMADIRRRKGL